MHVTPNEVAGLQALAQQNGSSLTINPDTGLPEAFSLDGLLPSIVGAGISYFSGGAIDPMTAGALVGGAVGLTSGSLEKGLVAGLGAYGGADLTSGLSSLGASALTQQGYGAAQTAAAAKGLEAGSAAYDSFIQDQMMNSGMTTGSRIGAGFGDVTSSLGNVKDFLLDNKWAIGAAALPALAGADQNSGIAALKNQGYVRRYRENPETGALEQYEAIPVDDFGSQSAVTFGGVGKPVKYDEGGAVNAGNYLVYNPTTKTYDKASGPVSFGAAKPENMFDPNDTRSDSQKAYEYLMGVPGAKNPMLFNYRQKDDSAFDVVPPPDLNTRTGGHYVINASKTGYDWVPDSNAGLEAIAENFKSPGGPGGPGMASNPGNIGTSMSGFDNAVNSIVGRVVNAMDPTVNPNKDTMEVSDFSTLSDAAVAEANANAQAQADATASVAQAQANAVAAHNALAQANANAGDGLGSPGQGGGGAAGLGGIGVGGTGPGSSGAGGGIGSTGTGSGVGTGGVGPTCFVKGVLVTLSNGKQVAIENVEVGDVVRGQDGDNQVIAFDRPQLIIPDVRDGTLYGFNGGDKFITSEHPVMTKAGWKAIDQDKAKRFEPHLSEVLVGNLTVGDELLMLDGAYLVLDSIETYTEQPQQQLYNLMLGGDHTYYVNRLLVHNKTGGGASGVPGGIGGGASGPAGPGSGPGGSCFLTTAAVSHMKQKDNGEVLNALREFRDTYMRKNKEKSKDVSWYYKNAPRIVAALDARPDADKVYKKMYRDFIKPAYDAIQEGDDEHAYEIYKDVVDFAEKHSGIKKKELTPRYGPNGMAAGGIAALARGGMGQLGSYSDGGQLLRGPGDGVSDSIPATIGKGQPARLADGEFVVPARIVSELGNGSTEAGAKQLYAMMARIQAGRAKTTGKNQVAKNSKAVRHLPA
jgi:hypothetical protein